MTKLHVKGRILQHLANTEMLWDYQIAELVFEEYGVSGDYWKGSIRVTLADLFSCGIVESIKEAIDDGTYFGKDKVLFCYKLTDFGRTRMQETKLL